MRKIELGTSGWMVPPIAVGCMRMDSLDVTEAETYIRFCMEEGADFFDHADIYGNGACETLFGRVLERNPELREQMLLQSKCGIVPDQRYDLSEAYLISSVEGILKRLHTDYLDVLLLHRPDALLEPEEIARAFDRLLEQGKVRQFGVSNENPMQMELLKKYVRQPLVVNQLQFSIPVSNLVSSGLEVNMTTAGSVMHDGSVLDYCRLQDITIQTWSPFQKPEWGGTFFGAAEYQKLNDTLEDVAAKYGVSATTIAAAWILRHPARMQLIAGSMKTSRMKEIFQATELSITREEWYRIYLSAGHILP